MGYTDLTSAFAYKDLVSWLDMDAVAENNKDDLLPAGTNCIFFQAAAPTLWTKEVANTDKALRVVSGTGGGTGGSDLLSAAIVLAHTHSASHTHDLPNHSHVLDNTVSAASFDTEDPIIGTGDILMSVGAAGGFSAGDQVKNITDTSGLKTSDATDPTDDSQLSNVSLAFIDVIVCSKDAGSYVDLSSTFEPRLLIVWQDWDQKAENSKFENIPAGTVIPFFQSAAPTAWTKLTTQNDKALRVVSGSGGGAGGSAATSATITLAHAHTFSASHTHNIGDHFHDFKFLNQTVLGSVPHSPTRRLATEGATKGTIMGYTNAGSDNGISELKGTFNAPNGGDLTTGSASPTMDSQLSNVTLAHIDFIICSKDANGYLDLTSEFDYKDLLTFQNQDQIAENNDFDHWEVNTTMAFFQASPPANWNKLTAQNDKICRVVSGSGGGAGGSDLLSATITLAHTHGFAHTHSTPAHVHDVKDDGAATDANMVQKVVSATSDDSFLFTVKAGSTSLREIHAQTKTDGSATTDSKGTTDSQLSDLNLAFIDVVLGQKT